MPVEVQILAVNGRRILTNELGQFVVATGDYDLTNFKSMNATGTSFNFYTPLPNKQFCITNIVAFATKDVSDATAFTVVIYEGVTASTTTVDRIVLEFGIGKLTPMILQNQRIIISHGAYLNAKTGDATISLNIIGHFIPRIPGRDFKSAPGIG